MYFEKHAVKALIRARALVENAGARGHKETINKELEYFETDYRTFESSALITYYANIKNFTMSAARKRIGILSATLQNCGSTMQPKCRSFTSSKRIFRPKSN